jgi:ParB family chromosome partitioning protein
MTTAPKPPAIAMMPIAKIKIGKRTRKDLGDVEWLAESIEDLGLLHPITVDEGGYMQAGARRLAACKLLGRTEIAVIVVRARE